MAEASVTEEQVQRGERVEAPALRAKAGGGRAWLNSRRSGSRW